MKWRITYASGRLEEIEAGWCVVNQGSLVFKENERGNVIRAIAPGNERWPDSWRNLEKIDDDR